jgi:hypothetical protein
LAGQKEDLEDDSAKKDLKPLRDFWSSRGLDENEKFLRDYILNKGFKDKQQVLIRALAISPMSSNKSKNLFIKKIKNTIKLRNWGPPWKFCAESTDPPQPGVLAKI